LENVTFKIIPWWDQRFWKSSRGDGKGKMLRTAA